MNLIKQTYHSNTDKFDLQVPTGYQVLSVTQSYPDIIYKPKLKSEA